MQALWASELLRVQIPGFRGKATPQLISLKARERVFNLEPDLLAAQA